ncbi:MAG: hypothetical protein AB7O97_08255 [Planctomycetota bacterium]
MGHKVQDWDLRWGGAGAAAAAAGGASGAYNVAAAGGRHAGLLANSFGKSAAEINKGIWNLEKNAALHRVKALNPSKFADDWLERSAVEREGLMKYWRKEAANYQQQADVLRGLLERM